MLAGSRRRGSRGFWEDGKLDNAVVGPSGKTSYLIPSRTWTWTGLISWLIFLHSHNSGKAFPLNTNHIYVLSMLVFNADVNYGLHEMR